MPKGNPDFSPVHLGGSKDDGVHDFRPKPVVDSPKSAPEPVDSPTHPSEDAPKKEPVKTVVAGKSDDEQGRSALVKKTPPQRAKRTAAGKDTSS